MSQGTHASQFASLVSLFILDMACLYSRTGVVGFASLGATFIPTIISVFLPGSPFQLVPGVIKFKLIYYLYICGLNWQWLVYGVQYDFPEEEKPQKIEIYHPQNLFLDA